AAVRRVPVGRAAPAGGVQGRELLRGPARGVRGRPDLRFLRLPPGGGAAAGPGAAAQARPPLRPLLRGGGPRHPRPGLRGPPSALPRRTGLRLPDHRRRRRAGGRRPLTAATLSPVPPPAALTALGAGSPSFPEKGRAAASGAGHPGRRGPHPVVPEAVVGWRGGRVRPSPWAAPPPSSPTGAGAGRRP